MQVTEERNRSKVTVRSKPELYRVTVSGHGLQSRTRVSGEVAYEVLRLTLPNDRTKRRA